MAANSGAERADVRLKKSPIQFRLRTLLLFTLVCAAALGICVSAIPERISQIFTPIPQNMIKIETRDRISISSKPGQPVEECTYLIHSDRPIEFTWQYFSRDSHLSAQSNAPIKSHAQWLGYAAVLKVKCVREKDRVLMYDVTSGDREPVEMLQLRAGAHTEPFDLGCGGFFSEGVGWSMFHGTYSGNSAVNAEPVLIGYARFVK